MNRRFRIYRSDKARHYLCICSGRDAAHALRIARRYFTLTKTAYAVSEVL